MKEINVNNCEIIGRGGQGTIYRLDEETIVKLDPQVIGRNLQGLGLVYAFFLTLFLGEESLHPETEKAAPSIVERVFRGAVLPNAQALKLLLGQ